MDEATRPAYYAEALVLRQRYRELIDQQFRLFTSSTAATTARPRLPCTS